ncbi:MAG: ATP-binding protein [Bacteroidota bacterium]
MPGKQPPENSQSHSKRMQPSAKMQLDFLLAHLPLIFFQLDRKGYFTEISGSLAGPLAIETAQWLGHHYEEVAPVYPTLVTGISRSLRGETFSAVWAIENSSRFQVTLLPILDSSGQVAWLLGAIAPQETQDKNWRQEMAQGSLLRYFIRHAPASIAMFDTDMRYLMVSDEWLESYRIDENLIGRNHYEVFPDIPERWKKVHQRCLKGVIERCERDPFVHEDGRVDYINWVVAPWYQEDNQVGGLIFYTLLVNDQVDLEQEQAEVAERLRVLNQRLEDFALAVSHTLRDPLRHAIMTGQRVLLKLQDEGTADLLQDGQSWLNQMFRLEKIVAGLLDSAHLKARARYHQVDLTEVMQEVATNLKPLVEGRRAQLLFGVLPSVFANEFEMVALFQQLIANAIEYSEDQVEVIISGERQGDFWLIRVQDNGSGLSPDQKEALFSFARQLDVSRPRTPGIGLPVCKRIIEHAGGNLWVESEPGQGSIFYFTLPAIEDPDLTKGIEGNK